VAVLLAAVVMVVVAAVAVAVAVVVAGAVESTLTLFFWGGEWGNMHEKTQTTCKASSWPALKNRNTRSVM